MGKGKGNKIYYGKIEAKLKTYQREAEEKKGYINGKKYQRGWGRYITAWDWESKIQHNLREKGGGGEMYIKENEGETYITDGERKRMSIKVKGGM